ncbi:MAG: hypothetical protein ACYC8T_35520, partial [Myxococcaceae bacterium]
MKISRLFAALCLMTVAGCRCDPEPPAKNKPDFDPIPKALSFEACPNRDEGGAEVKDVFPDEQKVALTNLGKAAGDVLVTFTGADATAFFVGDAGTPASLGPGSTTDLPIVFSPTKKGDATATLVIDDG